jgi:hypothetical protein
MNNKYSLFLFFSLIFIGCDTFSGVVMKTNELNVPLIEINNLLKINFAEYEFRIIDNGDNNQYNQGQYIIIYDSDKILADVGYLNDNTFEISSIGLGKKSKEEINRKRDDLIKIRNCLINYYKNTITENSFIEKIYY